MQPIIYKLLTLLAITMAVLLPQGAIASSNDTFHLTIVTQTGDGKNDGTDDVRVYALINGDEKQKRRLDTGRDDFRVGASDRFENLEYTYPIEQIDRIVLKAEAGQDALFLRQISFQFFQGGRTSEVYTFKTKTWLSGEKADPGGNDKVFRFSKKIVLK